VSGKRNRNKGGKRHGTTSLAQHARVGQRVVPPLAGLKDKTTLITSNWFSDGLPNHLWACGHLALDLDAGLRLVSDATSAIRRSLEALNDVTLVTGTLTDFESVPEELRALVLQSLQDSGHYEEWFPEPWAHAMSLYTSAPGAWLVSPWLEKGVRGDRDLAFAWLSRAIDAGHHGQSAAATRAKTVANFGALAAGKLIGHDIETLNVWKRYPNISEEERSWFEPAMRATYNAFEPLAASAAEVDACERRQHWARTFWRANWTLFPCSPLDVRSTGAAVPGPAADEVRANRDRAIDYLTRRADAVRSKFLSAAGADPDLYDPDRYEVLTGLTGRLVRQSEAAVRVPVLWTREFGSWLLRAAIETKIVTAWLEHKSGDVFASYKDYGRGKLKLVKLHLENFINEHDDVDEDLRTYLEDLTVEVNQDLWEEWQEISIAKTFSGVNARDMAIDVGMKRDYDFVFAPASGVAHGDWVALDRDALTRCANPLHRWHRVVRTEGRSFVDPDLMDQVLDVVEDVVDFYCASIAKPLGVTPA
jgi:hypothetical protein